MEDFFDRFQRITGVSKYSTSEVITPSWVVSDMVDLLPSEVFAPESRFLDPAVKSGRFLAELYRRLMNSEAIKQAFPNEQARQQHILDNQLYGFATSGAAAAIARKQLYNDPTIAGNIHYTTAKDVVKEIQGAFENMKFDVVIGNPPYNNDIYLDFVTLGHNLSSQYTCMITPAKWQAKGGKKNEDFRKNIVPYMSKIVYYVNSGDIFDIREVTGISYYLIDKEVHDSKYIKTIDKLESHDKLNDDWHLEDNLITLHSRGLNNIVAKISGKKMQYSGGNGHKKVIVSLNLANGGRKTSFSSFSTDGRMNVVNPLVKLNSIGELAVYGTNYKVIYNLDSDDECDSFISYVNTRFIRFLIFMGVCGQSITNDETWRFVPDPGAFDHIFTDQELYQKYGLTPNEIAIIESVIKERK